MWNRSMGLDKDQIENWLRKVDTEMANLLQCVLFLVLCSYNPYNSYHCIFLSTHLYCR